MNKPENVKYYEGAMIEPWLKGYKEAYNAWERYHKEVISELLEACKFAVVCLKDLHNGEDSLLDKQLKQAIARGRV